MRVSSVLTLGAAALVSAAPVEERQAAALGEFQITNFVYGCTTTCDWSFDITVGPKFDHHPAVTNPVHCAGSTDITSFEADTCTAITGGKNSKFISAFIGPKNRLKLQYEISFPAEGSRYTYEGGRKVNAQTSGKPQASAFSVKETKAFAVA